MPEIRRQSPGGKTRTSSRKGNRRETQLTVYQENSKLERVLKALKKTGSEVRESGNGYTAHCPAHDDERPSLTITETAHGKVLMHCHANCAIEKIIARLRLQMSDLFAEGKIEDTYPYCPWPVCSPRFWPPEVPTPRDEFSVLASLGFPPLACLFHAERLAFGDDEHVVMEQPIEEADGR